MTEKTAPAPPAAAPPALSPLPPRPGLTAGSLLYRFAFWLFVVVFLAALYLPGFRFDDDKYWLPLFTKWMALALFALSVDLVWGYTGLLSLGQGLYFGIGAYLMAYYLDFHLYARNAADGVPGVTPTDFMMRGELTQIPGWLAPLANLSTTLLLIFGLPALV